MHILNPITVFDDFESVPVRLVPSWPMSLHQTASHFWRSSSSSQSVRFVGPLRPVHCSPEIPAVYVGSFLALLNARERSQSGVNSESSQSRIRDSFTSLPSPKRRVTSSFWSASVLPTLPTSRNPHTVRDASPSQFPSHSFTALQRHAFSPSEETKVVPPYNGPVAL